ncbi:MAG TPA: alkaline phosphatase family protein [Candidatus Cybelea sp.]|jgi:phospholipase C|nr:alkaline phosphatase family protein [Candidatus Cybelea sp.]
MLRTLVNVRWAALAAAFALGACSGGAPSLPGPSAVDAVRHVHRNTSSGKIQHVIIIVQENRSFNNLFYGFPGAKTAKFGYNSSNQKITLQPVGLETSWDLDHSSTSFFAACNGTGSYPGTDCQMNGFNNESVGCGHRYQPQCPNANPPYSYVPHTETKPYFQLGKEYVLADQMYASNFDASSFISHQYIIGAQANSAVNYPDSWWGCPGGSGDMVDTVNSQRQIGNPVTACWDSQTLGDELDNASIPWAFYTSTYNGDGGIWSAYQAISHIYNGQDWKNDIITPQTTFFSDISNGKLRPMSWITPTCENSDHAGCSSKTGPSWVASLVNAVGESQYWNNTAIFVFWDDYGGWYDPEPPTMLDYDGLGLRIPMLVISPYAKKHHVSHVPYEHGSILRWIENLWGLGQLAASDTRATPPDDAFDFNQAPRKFKQVKSDYSIQYFMHQKPDTRIPDSE